jgi:HK97 family phage prohead protease
MGNEKKELERRSYTFEVRAENTERGHVITGRPVVYNSRTDLGLFDEIIEAGALDHTDLTDVRFMVNHDTSKIPLARSRRNNGNSTMLLTVDSEGLGIRVDLDTENNADARALYSAVERGDIDGMSFAMAVRGDKWDDLTSEHPTRRVTDISKVVEVSAVTFPAYTATTIDARSKEALDNARAQAALDSAKAAEGDTLDSVDETRSLDLEKAKTHILATMKL